MPSIPEEDLEFSFFRSSGPGGQKRNKTESSVRLRHLPTGITVIATASRSQHRNKQEALEELERRLELRNRRRTPRIATAPTRSSERQRMEQKRKRADKKRLRKPPGADD